MPAAIENEPNVVKNDMNAAPGRVGGLERVLLRVVGLEAERARPRAAARASTCVGRPRRPPRVRDEDRLDEPRLAEELLRRRERHQHARRRRCRRRRSRRSPSRSHVAARSPGEELRGCRPACASSLSAAFGVEVDLARRRAGRARRSRPPARICAEAAHAAGVGREQRHARLGLAARGVLTATGSTITGCDAVDQARSAGVAARAGPRSPAGSSAQPVEPPRARERGVDALGARSPRRSVRARRSPRSGSCGSSCRRSRARRR